MFYAFALQYLFCDKKII